MSKKGRVTVTLDQALLDAANEEVAEGRAESLSACINLALSKHLEKARRLAGMAEVLADYEAEYGEFTAEELAEQERADRRNAIVIRGSGKRGSGNRGFGKRGSAKRRTKAA